MITDDQKIAIAKALVANTSIQNVIKTDREEAKTVIEGDAKAGDATTNPEDFGKNINGLTWQELTKYFTALALHGSDNFKYTISETDLFKTTSTTNVNNQAENNPEVVTEATTYVTKIADAKFINKDDNKTSKTLAL